MAISTCSRVHCGVVAVKIAVIVEDKACGKNVDKACLAADQKQCTGTYRAADGANIGGQVSLLLL